MRALTTAVVSPGGVLASVDCQPPVTLRQVRSDDPEVCALCLVGTAAGPLAGDALVLELDVEDGARASLQAAGASVAQGRHDGAGQISTVARLGSGAALLARPGAVIVGAGSQVDVSVRLVLAADSHVEWRELVVLGRSAEAPGAATLRWDVERGGRPVVRQLVSLTDPVVAAWPGMLGGGRVIASALVSGPDVEASTRVLNPMAVAARLDPHTQLITVLGVDAATVAGQLDELSAGVRTRSVTTR